MFGPRLPDCSMLIALILAAGFLSCLSMMIALVRCVSLEPTMLSVYPLLDKHAGQVAQRGTEPIIW